MSARYSELQALRKTLDAGGMFDLVAAFPDHMKVAWKLGAEWAGRLSREVPRRVVVCGMGGSAIGADMVRSFLGEHLDVPVHVHRGYAVPARLIEGAMIVFSSYSGNTAETISAYRSVRNRGVPVAAITSGGALGDLCIEDAVPVCRIPGGMPPRAAVAYSFFPLLHLLSACGAAPLVEDEFGEACGALHEVAEKYGSDSEDNLAAGLAYELKGAVPVIYSCNGLLGAVTRRWKCQFNENSEVIAHSAEFPELAHNEIVGWREGGGLLAQGYVVVLEDEDDRDEVRRQAAAALEIIEPLAVGVTRVSGRGGRMARILSVMMLGDFTSVYLAFLNGVDPTPVSNIDLLKRRSAQEPPA